jgi:hypothetical protein
LSKDPESDLDGDLDVARDVVRYFVRNPDAADTVEGVARWRLLDEKIYRNVEQVTRALAWLVEHGLLVEVPLPSSRTAFRLNATAREQIERFLQEASRRPGGRSDAANGQRED